MLWHVAPISHGLYSWVSIDADRSTISPHRTEFYDFLTHPHADPNLFTVIFPYYTIRGFNSSFSFVHIDSL